MGSCVHEANEHQIYVKAHVVVLSEYTWGHRGQSHTTVQIIT